MVGEKERQINEGLKTIKGNMSLSDILSYLSLKGYMGTSPTDKEKEIACDRIDELSDLGLVVATFPDKGDKIPGLFKKTDEIETDNQVLYKFVDADTNLTVESFLEVFESNLVTRKIETFNVFGLLSCIAIKKRFGEASIIDELDIKSSHSLEVECIIKHYLSKLSCDKDGNCQINMSEELAYLNLKNNRKYSYQVDQFVSDYYYLEQKEQIILQKKLGTQYK